MPCEAVAEEMKLRRTFFASRIDGYVAPAERKDRADVAENEPESILLCRACGILVRGGSNAEFASDPYAPYVMEQMLRTYINAFRHRAPHYRPLLPEGAKVIEIGSYVGGFLHVAREWGWDAMGIDVGDDTSHFARSKGYPTRTATLQECAFDDESFEGVFVWNTFEQLDDPRALLAEAGRVLRPRGVLVIRTPNALFYRFCEAMLSLRRPRALDDHDAIVVALAHTNLLGFPHRFGFDAPSLDALVTPFGFDAVEHVSDRHIAQTARYTTAALREAERVDQAIAAMEQAFETTAVVGPWIEVTYRVPASS